MAEMDDESPYYCGACGASLWEEQQVCVRCGARVDWKPATQAADLDATLDAAQVEGLAAAYICHYCGAGVPAGEVRCLRCGERVRGAVIAPERGFRVQTRLLSGRCFFAAATGMLLLFNLTEAPPGWKLGLLAYICLMVERLSSIASGCGISCGLA